MNLLVENDQGSCLTRVFICQTNYIVGRERGKVKWEMTYFLLCSIERARTGKLQKSPYEHTEIYMNYSRKKNLVMQKP